LILNTSNILDDDGTFIATTEIHKQEPDNDLIMMMPNDTNLSQNMLDTTNRSNFTLLGSSIDDLILNNTKINCKNIASKNSKNRKLIDVLKAADGDIIFGNNIVNKNLNEKKKQRCVNSSRKNFNKASTIVGSIASAFASTGQENKINKNFQKDIISFSNNQLDVLNESLNSTTTIFLVKDMKKNEILNNNSLNQSCSFAEKIIKNSKSHLKLKKTERYLSPFKNMLKSKQSKLVSNLQERETDLKNSNNEKKQESYSINGIHDKKLYYQDKLQKKFIEKKYRKNLGDKILNKSKLQPTSGNNSDTSSSKLQTDSIDAISNLKSYKKDQLNNHSGLTVRKVKNKKKIHSIENIKEPSSKTKYKTFHLSSIEKNECNYSKSRTSKTHKESKKTKSRKKKHNGKNGFFLISSKFSIQTGNNDTNDDLKINKTENEHESKNLPEKSINELKISSSSFSNLENINEKDIIDLSSLSSNSLKLKTNRKLSRTKKFSKSKQQTPMRSNSKSSLDSESSKTNLRYSKTMKPTTKKKKIKENENKVKLKSKNEFEKTIKNKKNEENKIKKSRTYFPFRAVVNNSHLPSAVPLNSFGSEPSKTMPIAKDKSKIKSKKKNKNIQESKTINFKIEKDTSFNKFSSKTLKANRILPPNQPPPPPPLNLMNNNNIFKNYVGKNTNNKNMLILDEKNNQKDKLSITSPMINYNEVSYLKNNI
jgi:hypothetical protein